MLPWTLSLTRSQKEAVLRAKIPEKLLCYFGGGTGITEEERKLMTGSCFVPIQQEDKGLRYVSAAGACLFFQGEET